MLLWDCSGDLVRTGEVDTDAELLGQTTCCIVQIERYGTCADTSVDGDLWEGDKGKPKQGDKGKPKSTAVTASSPVTLSRSAGRSTGSPKQPHQSQMQHQQRPTWHTSRPPHSPSNHHSLAAGPGLAVGLWCISINSTLLHNMQLLVKPTQVQLSDGRLIQACTQGDLHGQIHVNNHELELFFPDVLHIP